MAFMAGEKIPGATPNVKNTADPSQMAALKIPMARKTRSTAQNYRLKVRKPSGEAEQLL
jgi:hypothetical protein